MPRESVKRMRGQQQVNAQETFDPTVPKLRVHASAVDPYVAQGRSADAEALLQFAGQFNGLQRQASGLLEDRAAELKEKGKHAAERGIPKPEPDQVSSSFYEGYEEYEGKANVADYIKAHSELDAKAHNLTPEEYAAETERIDREFITGRSDAFLKGFVPSAMAHKEAYAEKYRQTNNAIVKNNFLANTRKVAYSEGKRILEDPNIVDKSAELRKLLSAQQQMGKDKLSLADRNEIADEFLSVIGDEAVRTGHPEWMLFGYLQDESGHSLAQRPEVADKLDQYTNAAISEDRRLRREALEAAEKAKKEVMLAGQREIVDAIFSGDITKIQQAEMKMEQLGKSLPPDDLWKLRKAFQDLKDGNDGNFAPVTNESTFTRLRVMAKFGDLQWADLPMFQSMMSKQDYRQLFADIVTREEKKIADSKVGRDKKSKAELMIEDQEKSGLGISMQKDKLGAFINPLGANQRQGLFQLYYRNILDTLEAQYKGAANIPYEEIVWAKDKAAWKAYQPEIGIPPVGMEKAPPDPDDKRQQEKAAAQSLETYDPGQDDFFLAQ